MAPRGIVTAMVSRTYVLQCPAYNYHNGWIGCTLVTLPQLPQLPSTCKGSKARVQETGAEYNYNVTTRFTQGFNLCVILWGLPVTNCTTRPAERSMEGSP